MTDKSKQTKRSIPALNPSALKEGDYAVQRLVAIAPIGATPDDILVPEFWVHVAQQVRNRGAHIEVWADDNSWWCELLVVRAGVKGLVVKPIHAMDLNVTAAAEKKAKKQAAAKKVPAGYDVAFVPGGDQKWRVTRSVDGEVLRFGFTDRDEAIEWAQEHDASTGGPKVRQPEPETEAA